MKIKFNHPIVNGNSHFEEFNPNDISQYPEGVGIYCYGFRKKIDGKKVFIPLYVGISENLKDRLFQHYKEERSNGNSKWYVFDYTSLKSNTDVSDLYNDMMISDSKKGINISRYSNKLIWFNNSSFFNIKLKVTCSKYKSNSGVRSGMMAYLVLRTFFSPIGSFILSLLPFVFLWGLYNYFFGFRIWVSISFLIYCI